MSSPPDVVGPVELLGVGPGPVLPAGLLPAPADPPEEPAPVALLALASPPVVPPVLPVPASLQQVHLVPRQQGEVVLQLDPGHHLQAVVQVGGRRQQVDCPDDGQVPWGRLALSPAILRRQC